MQTNANDAQRLAMDIGSGDVKVFYVDDSGIETFFKFPTAISRQEESSTSFSMNSAKKDQTDRESYEMDGIKYIVGEKAVKSAINTRAFDFHLKYDPLFAYYAIEKAGFDIQKPIELNIGLTIKDWHEAENMISRLENIIINGEKLNTKVVSCHAQGQGSFIDEGSPSGEILIVDGGHNTLDTIAFEDGTPIPEKCMANTYGANKMIESLKKIISKKYHVEVKEQHAKKIFKDKHINILGDKIDLSEVVRDEQKKYLEELFIEMRGQYGSDYLNLADQVIFTGGLAYFMEDVELPKNARLGKKPYEYSNVRGYYYG